MTDYITTSTTDPSQTDVVTNANVGIGTTTPDELLHVKGGVLKIEDTSYPTLLFERSSGGTDAKRWKVFAATNEFKILLGNDADTVGADAIHITRNEMTCSSIRLNANTYPITSNSFDLGTAINLWKNVYAKNIKLDEKLYLDGGNDTYLSEVSANEINFVTGGSERLRIDSNGNIGIGTTDPQSKLHIEGDSMGINSSAITGPLISINQQSSSYTDIDGDKLGSLTFSGGNYSTGNIRIGSQIRAVAAGSWTGTSTPAHIYFGTTDTDETSPTDWMVLSNNGRLGISTFPNAKLHVVQAISDEGIPTLELRQDDVSEGFINYYGSSQGDLSGVITTRTNASIAGFVSIEINGTRKWMPYYNDPTS